MGIGDNFRKLFFDQKMKRYSDKYGSTYVNKYKDQLYKEYKQSYLELTEGKKPTYGWVNSHKDVDADAVNDRINELMSNSQQSALSDKYKDPNTGSLQAQSTLQGASQTGVPNGEQSVDTDKDTEQIKKANKRKGKRGLIIQRASGQGLNI